jgi:hypothetical protein
MRRIPHLALAVAGACFFHGVVDAQARIVTEAAGARAARERSSDANPEVTPVAALLKIAKSLRESGQVDVAKEIEAQARRLQRSQPTAVLPATPRVAATPGSTRSSGG